MFFFKNTSLGLLMTLLLYLTAAVTSGLQIVKSDDSALSPVFDNDVAFYSAVAQIVVNAVVIGVAAVTCPQGVFHA